MVNIYNAVECRLTRRWRGEIEIERSIMQERKEEERYRGKEDQEERKIKSLTHEKRPLQASWCTFSRCCGKR
jgi:hypothetical protein